MSRLGAGYPPDVDAEAALQVFAELEQQATARQKRAIYQEQNPGVPVDSVGSVLRQQEQERIRPTSSRAAAPIADMDAIQRSMGMGGGERGNSVEQALLDSGQYRRSGGAIADQEQNARDWLPALVAGGATAGAFAAPKAALAMGGRGIRIGGVRAKQQLTALLRGLGTTATRAGAAVPKSFWQSPLVKTLLIGLGVQQGLGLAPSAIKSAKDIKHLYANEPTEDELKADRVHAKELALVKEQKAEDRLAKKQDEIQARQYNLADRVMLLKAKELEARQLDAMEQRQARMAVSGARNSLNTMTTPQVESMIRLYSQEQ